MSEAAPVPIPLQKAAEAGERVLWHEERGVRAWPSLVAIVGIAAVVIGVRSIAPEFVGTQPRFIAFVVGVFLASMLLTSWIERRDRSWAVTDKKVYYWLNKKSRRMAPPTTSVDLSVVRLRGRGPPMEPLTLSAPFGPIGITMKPRVRDAEGMLRALKEAGVQSENA